MVPSSSSLVPKGLTGASRPPRISDFPIPDLRKKDVATLCGIFSRSVRNQTYNLCGPLHPVSNSNPSETIGPSSDCACWEWAHSRDLAFLDESDLKSCLGRVRVGACTRSDVSVVSAVARHVEAFTYVLANKKHALESLGTVFQISETASQDLLEAAQRCIIRYLGTCFPEEEVPGCILPWEIVEGTGAPIRYPYLLERPGVSGMRGTMNHIFLCVSQ